jgi:hypothetical protein
MVPVPPTGLTISTSALPDRLVLEAVDHFNRLRSYPLTREEIMKWAMTLEQVVPNLDPLALCWLVDEMLAGRYDYDRFSGIQQLTIGLQKVEKINQTYQLKTDFPG